MKGNNSSVIDWLLKEDQPSVRYLTLRELLGRSEKDSEVKSARESITNLGCAKGMLDKQLPSGFWYHDKNLFLPRFLSTFWMLLVLSDLGLTKKRNRKSTRRDNCGWSAIKPRTDDSVRQAGRKPDISASLATSLELW
ncbi:MAG: hypothetical protein ACREBS_04880 [Nitrososphaerales archaeon]